MLFARNQHYQNIKINFWTTLLKVENLINSIDISWNIDFLNAYIHVENVKIIKGLVISRISKQDTAIWNFTMSSKYTVKSRYMMDAFDRRLNWFYMNQKENRYCFFVLKLKCPPKLHHFVCHIISSTLLGTKRLQSYRIQCNTWCCICRAEEESSNHDIWMPTSSPDIGAFTNNFEPKNFSNIVTFHQYGLFILKMQEIDQFRFVFFF